jgi:hypothetical protein
LGPHKPLAWEIEKFKSLIVASGRLKPLVST